MPSPTASDYFGAMADSYDALIERAVPRYREMTDRLTEYLPRSATRILDLGCGTGNLTLRLAANHPAAAITAVDAAPEMTALTAERMGAAGAADRLRTIIGRFEDLSFPAGSFDLVTSCISLHHVRDKADLYRRIHGWLVPGGTFRFADQLRGGTEELHSINWARWLEFCRRPGGCSEAEVQSLLDHAAAHDHYTPLAEHFGLLSGAGFAGLDCVWRNWIWGIVTADR
jgi:tRNA (cmo5U34)-methyltransferase